MTELLEKAVRAIQQMPAADQDAIAEAMLSLARISEPDRIDEKHLSDVLTGLDEIRRGDIATDAEVAAAFRRFDR